MTQDDEYGDWVRFEDYDALRLQLANRTAEVVALLEQVAALKEAAGKVTCKTCDGHGTLLLSSVPAPGYYYTPCPDCGPLRAILEKQP
jgi:hypothetical protein